MSCLVSSNWQQIWDKVQAVTVQNVLWSNKTDHTIQLIANLKAVRDFTSFNEVNIFLFSMFENSRVIEIMPWL